MTKGFNYDKMMQQGLHRAFRQMLADVLSQVAQSGLPGDHHFFITFDTTHPGVDMHASLRARYPKEMMIVLQDWFENLAVMKDRFTVTLNFGDVPEPIVVPFDAITTFVDPSCEFGMRFEAQEGTDDDDDDDDAPTPPEPGPAKNGDAEIVRLDKFRKT
jgi:hypothetical protein